jgi:hypothetical protein
LIAISILIPFQAAGAVVPHFATQRRGMQGASDKN